MYKIIGADGREYGPASLEQVKQWVAEGRINAQTRIKPEDSVEWKQAGEIAELGAVLAPPTLSPPETTAALPPTIAPTAALPAHQKGLAVTTFVLGVASFALCLGVITGIPAIICGHVARNRTRWAPNQYGGGGLATAGLILGYLSVLYTLLIVAMLAPASGNARSRARTTMCTSHMKQIGLAFRIWGVDHQGQFPFNVSTNAGGTMEFCKTGFDGFDRNATKHFAALAKELGTATVLVCPSDRSKRPAHDFDHLTAQNASYLLRTGPDVTDTNLSEMLLKCPVHGTVLRCDGNVEPGGQRRRLRL